MGCFGGMTALYVAKNLIEADKTGRAVVLVCCAEACSSHMSDSSQIELVIGNTLFADGAAAAIVTHAGFQGHKPSNFVVPADGRLLQAGASAASAAALSEPEFEWALGDMSSEIVPNSETDMTWKQGNAGGQYNMFLARTIADSLASTFTTRGVGLLRRVGISNPWTCGWAVHPGGKAIINGFETAFQTLRIKGDGLEVSREVLRSYGNMSSATILFVLQRVLTASSRSDIFFAGFGPGLTIEFGRIHRVRVSGNGGAYTDAAAALDAEAHSEATSQSVSPSSGSDAEGEDADEDRGARARGGAGAASSGARRRAIVAE